MQTANRILTSTAIAFACAVALQAQSPTSTVTNRTIPGAVTVTGCVERADEVAGNGAATTTVDSQEFVLIRAVKGTAAETPTGTSGTTVPPISKDTTYRLDAAASTLNPHVGQKVEVTGAVLAPAIRTSDAVNPAPIANAPTIKVAHVKMLSATCDR